MKIADNYSRYLSDITILSTDRAESLTAVNCDTKLTSYLKENAVNSIVEIVDMQVYLTG